MNKEIAKLGFWVVGILFTIAVVGLVAKLIFFPVNVAHTAMNSANGIVEKTLNSNNVIHNYEWFYDVTAQFDSRVNQIKAHKSLVVEEKNPSEKSRLNIELQGMRQSCRDLATKYNANSEKMNRSLFKSKSLPEVLSIQTCEV